MGILKKYLSDQIQGWLPKEPSPDLPNNQKIKAFASDSKIDAISARTIGAMGLGSFLSGFILLSVPYFLFPEHYVPKADSAWGYVAPKTMEAWLILAAAIGLIFLAIFAFTLCGIKLKLQDSKWMKYTYWIAPRQESGRFWRNQFKITVAANTLMVAAFLGFIVFTTITTQSAQSTFSALIVFAVLITLVNLFLYEFSKKKIAEQKETSYT